MKRNNHVDTRFNFLLGEKVLYHGDNRVYDFGYETGNGRAIIYEEGSRDIESSISVPLEDLVKARRKK